MVSIVESLKKNGKNPVVKKALEAKEVKKQVSHEMIAKIAYELYEKRGKKPGFEDQDWQEAKRILGAS